MRRLFQSVRLLPYASTVNVRLVGEAQALLQQVREGAYASASATMAGVHEGDQVNFYACLGELKDAMAIAAQWLAAEPDSADAALLLAFAELGEAWRVRGEDYYDDIPAARRRAFPLKFQAAQTRFKELAARIDPPPLAFYGMLHCDVVCDIERDARSERFAQVMAMVPFHAPSVHMLAKASMGKWDGSDEQMWAYLRWISAHAPRGRDAHAVIAWHVVEWAETWVDECNAPLEIVGVVRGQSARTGGPGAQGATGLAGRATRRAGTRIGRAHVPARTPSPEPVRIGAVLQRCVGRSACGDAGAGRQGAGGAVVLSGLPRQQHPQ
ncbi:hypothetical protein IAE57_07015 [Stenotrophomonas sp. S48]|uniref:hypothetical protein n=1 Tax=unclassified Stenotrophomonas TaxID=196198 RepID=UPI001902B8D1|nr:MULTISPECIES: hypothetical protein [unclassified Stenotrophomonas]MBK0025906.1 hypothetical protein [Stenotrophomonas sp. S48]MBK0047793.1 hypothetical protein [Stenotrophomonas sp. S49]